MYCGSFGVTIFVYNKIMLLKIKPYEKNQKQKPKKCAVSYGMSDIIFLSQKPICMQTHLYIHI